MALSSQVLLLGKLCASNMQRVVLFVAVIGRIHYLCGIRDDLRHDIRRRRSLRNRFGKGQLLRNAMSFFETEREREREAADGNGHRALGSFSPNTRLSVRVYTLSYCLNLNEAKITRPRTFSLAMMYDGCGFDEL